MHQQPQPIVLVTGAAGHVGGVVARALGDGYTIVGMDQAGERADVPLIAADFTDDASVRGAFAEFKEAHGTRIASIIHLAAFFDFTGEEHPLYQSLNVEGTRRLLAGLDGVAVEQFVFISTMLVAQPGQVGERIDERQPAAPQWAYPASKARAEQVIRERRGAMPTVILRLAGLYGDRTVVPTLAHQIERIRSRDLQSHLYSGDTDAAQSMIHEDDLAELMRRVVDRRATLPAEAMILAGEPDPPGYDTLQDRIGELLHGEHWATLRVPSPLAAAGAWVQEKVQPLLPDALGGGKEPFVRPFMTTMASDHYAPDISRARALLGWEPKHRLMDTLPTIIADLKRDPEGWLKANKVDPDA